MFPGSLFILLSLRFDVPLADGVHANVVDPHLKVKMGPADPAGVARLAQHRLAALDGLPRL